MFSTALAASSFLADELSFSQTATWPSWYEKARLPAGPGPPSACSSAATCGLGLS